MPKGSVGIEFLNTNVPEWRGQVTDNVKFFVDSWAVAEKYAVASSERVKKVRETEADAHVKAFEKAEKEKQKHAEKLEKYLEGVHQRSILLADKLAEAQSKASERSATAQQKIIDRLEAAKAKADERAQARYEKLQERQQKADERIAAKQQKEAEHTSNVQIKEAERAQSAISKLVERTRNAQKQALDNLANSSKSGGFSIFSGIPVTPGQTKDQAIKDAIASRTRYEIELEGKKVRDIEKILVGLRRDYDVAQRAMQKSTDDRLKGELKQEMQATQEKIKVAMAMRNRLEGSDGKSLFGSAKEAAEHVVGSTISNFAGGAGAGIIIKEIGQAGIEANERIEKLRAGLQYTGTAVSQLTGQTNALVTSTFNMANSLGQDNHALQEATAHYMELGGSQEDLVRKQQAIIILAEKAGVSLEQAATFAVKGFSDELNLKLTRFGIALDKSLPPAEQFNQFMRQAAPLMDAIKERANGISGDIARAKNEFDRAKDAAGLLLIQGIQPLAKGFNFLAEGIYSARDAQENYNEAVQKGKIPEEDVSDRLAKIGLLFSGNFTGIKRLNAEYHLKVEASKKTTDATGKETEATGKLSDAQKKAAEDMASDTLEMAKQAEKLGFLTSEYARLKGVMDSFDNKRSRLTILEQQGADILDNMKNYVTSPAFNQAALKGITAEISSLGGELGSHNKNLKKMEGYDSSVDHETGKGPSKDDLENPLKAEQARFELAGIEMNRSKEFIELGLLNIQIKYDEKIAASSERGSNRQVQYALDAAHARERVHEINLKNEEEFNKSVAKGKELEIKFEEELSKKQIELNKEVLAVRAREIKKSNDLLSDLMAERLGILKDDLEKEVTETKKYTDLAKRSMEDLFSPLTSQVNSLFDKLPKGIGTFASGLMKIGIDKISDSMFKSKKDTVQTIDTATITITNASLLMDLPKIGPPNMNTPPLPPGGLSQAQQDILNQNKLNNGQGTNFRQPNSEGTITMSPKKVKEIEEQTHTKAYYEKIQNFMDRDEVKKGLSKGWDLDNSSGSLDQMINWKGLSGSGFGSATVDEWRKLRAGTDPNLPNWGGTGKTSAFSLGEPEMLARMMPDHYVVEPFAKGLGNITNSKAFGADNDIGQYYKDLALGKPSQGMRIGSESTSVNIPVQEAGFFPNLNKNADATVSVDATKKGTEQGMLNALKIAQSAQQGGKKSTGNAVLSAAETGLALIPGIGPLLSGGLGIISSLFQSTGTGNSFIPNYYAKGTQYVEYKPKGTDTVPAMLTPGETVYTAAQQQDLTKNIVGMGKRNSRLSADLADLAGRSAYSGGSSANASVSTAHLSKLDSLQNEFRGLRQDIRNGSVTTRQVQLGINQGIVTHSSSKY